MSEDLIRRQAAIDEFNEWLDKTFNTDFILAHGSAKWLAELPTAEPRWIPVTERLPERGVSVLISHVGYVSEDYLDIDELIGAEYFWNNGINLGEELNNLAWMPLPEPWKGESDG